MKTTKIYSRWWLPLVLTAPAFLIYLITNITPYFPISFFIGSCIGLLWGNIKNIKFEKKYGDLINLLDKKRYNSCNS